MTDILASIIAILTNPTLWLILGIISVVAYGVLKTTKLNRLPGMKTPTSSAIVCAVLFLIFSGAISGLGSWGTGSLNKDSSSSWSVSNVQVATLSASVAGGTVALDSNNPYLINGRYTDAQANETASIYELNSSVFTIERSGDLKPDSCKVTVSSNDFNVDETTGLASTVPLNILQKDATTRAMTYIQSGTTQATTSSPQESTSIAFADGVATAQFTVTANIAESAHDALTQYSFRDVTIDVCGFPITYRVFRM